MKISIKIINLIIVCCTTVAFSLTAGQQRQLTQKQRSYVKSRATNKIDCAKCCKDGQGVSAECCKACNNCVLYSDDGRAACKDIPTM